MAHARLVVALVAILGCTREARLVQRELPGFSILVPEGRTVGTPTLDYASGYLALAVESPLRVAIVSWSPGTKLDSEQTRMVLQVMAPMVHSPEPGTITTRPGPLGTPVETLEMKTDAIPLLVTQVECGHRNVLLATGAESGGEDLHRRMLMSLQCKPDPAAEATLNDVHIDLAIELPGWYAASREDGQLELSDGKSALIIQPMAPAMSSKVAEAIAPMLTAAFHGAVTAEPASGGRVNLHGTFEGEPVIGWAKLIPCPKSKNLVMALASDQAASDAIDRAVAQGHCLPPGAPPQKWPDPPADGDADADGDAPAKAPAGPPAAAPVKPPAAAPR